MKNFRLLISTLLLSTIVFTSSYSQIKFDVKTLMDEKIQLKFVKLAVINYLQNSDWAKVVEFGENYSLWLTNLQRVNFGDSIKSEFDIQLRTPALISHGKHIMTKHISVTYDTSGCYQVANDSDTLISNLIIQVLQNTEVYSELLNLVSSSIPFGDFLFQKFISDFIAEFKRAPTPLEQLEANLLAAEVVVMLHNFIQNAE